MNVRNAFEKCFLSPPLLLVSSSAIAQEFKEYENNNTEGYIHIALDPDLGRGEVAEILVHLQKYHS